MKYFDTTILLATIVALGTAAPSKKYENATSPDEEYLIFGTTNHYSSSSPFYPSPLGGRIENVWEGAYTQARAIVDTLDITEKVNITTGIGMKWSHNVGSTGWVHGQGLEFPEGFGANDGPLGLRGADFVTAYPAALTVASSFNRQLMYDRADAIGYEYKSKGVDYYLGPVCGPIGYKALGGRNWEGFGADPYLQGEAMKYTVEGVQKNHVIAVSKHFIGNEQEIYRSEGEGLKEDGSDIRSAISSNIDDRSMHEIYLWPFAEAVKAGTGSVMCSYNRINGSAGCANSYTLNNLLKTELGFQGFVMSDWFGTISGVLSALAGLDMNMPGDNRIGDGSYFGGNLTQAILNGTIPEDRLNDMTTRILASYFAIEGNHTGPNFSFNSKKTYDYEVYDASTGKGYGEIVMVNEHVDPRNDFTDKMAYQSAIEGIVLLKNENEALPLNVTKLAIFGEAAGRSADGVNCILGNCTGGAPLSGYGSGAGSPSKFISPAEGLGDRCRKEGIQYDFVSSSWDFEDVIDRAVPADAAIVFAASVAGEGFVIVDGNQGDLNNASLWYNADELIKTVTANNNNTIVVVTAPGPINIESFVENENVTAIVMSSYLGQEAGSTITDVLFGDYNPSGRLPFTIAKNDLDYVPVIYNTTLDKPQDDFTRSIFLDYRYFDYYNITPRYEFGYGLSHSNFTFGNLKISEIKMPAREMMSDSDYLTPYEFSPSSLNPEDYIFPEGFNKLNGFIYPYLENTNVNTTETFEYPEGYSTEQLTTPPISGGSLGGNKQLWEVAYNVEAELTNNGPHNGAYVAQLYIGIPSSDQLPNAPRQLRGFDKISLNADESAKVKFDISRKDLSVWDVVSQSWIVQSGDYTIYVGSSSRNLELVDTIVIS